MAHRTVVRAAALLGALSVVIAGCGGGKTTTARCVLRAYDPSSGQILFHSAKGQVVDLAKIPRSKLRPLRKNKRRKPASSI